MINKTTVQQAVEEWLQGKDYFLVDINISADDRIVVETDSPYLPPVPMRGKRNDPSNLRYICAKIAEIKGVQRRHEGKSAAAGAQAVLFVPHGSYGDARLGIARQRVRHFHGDGARGQERILGVNTIRLVNRDEIRSQFGVYFYAGEAAEQCRHGSQSEFHRVKSCRKKRCTHRCRTRSQALPHRTEVPEA